MNRKKRLLLYVLCGIVLAAVLISAIGHWHLKREVTSQLVEFNGARVTVDRVDLGIRQHRVHGTRLFESADGDSVWMEIESLNVDFPIWRAIFGTAKPDRISIGGAVIRLNVDSQGRLTSGLPDLGGGGDLPADAIDIERARLEIRPQDHEPITADSIRLAIRRRGDHIHADGQVEDALGGAWSFSTTTDVSSLRTAGKLSSSGVRFATEDLIAQLLLPDSLTEQLRAEAVTPVELTFTYEPASQLQYRAELNPHSIGVQLRRKDWHLNDGHGNIVIEDGVVSVSDFSGAVLGGQVGIGGRADLRQEPWRGQFDLQLTDVNISQTLPFDPIGDITAGACSGQAEFQFVIPPEGASLEGNGKGTIRDVKFRGIQTDPVTWAVDLATRQGDGPRAVTGQVRFDVAVTDVDIADTLQKLEIETHEATGRLSLTSVVRVPLETVADPRTYAVAGDLKVPQAKLAGTEMRDVQGVFAYSSGKIELRRLRGSIAAEGSVSGELDAEILPAGNVAVRVDFDEIPNTSVVKSLLQRDVPIAGASTGRLEATVPVDRWHDVDAWSGKGNAKCERLSAGDLKLDDAAASLLLDRGRLSLTGGTAKWHEASLRADGSVSFDSPHEFKGQIDLTNIDLENIAKRRNAQLPISMDGYGSFHGNVQGTLGPFAWSADGNGQLPDFLLDERPVKNARFRWKADASGLDVTELTAELLDGDVQLAAELPFDTGNHSRIHGSFRDLDAATLQDISPSPDVKLAGRVSGDVDMTAIGSAQNRKGEIRFRGVQATVFGATVHSVASELSFSPGRTRVELNGEVLGGAIGFKADLSPTASDSSDVQLGGRVTLKGARLSQLWPLLGLRQPLGSVRAVADGEFDVQLSRGSAMPTGNGHLYLRRPSWAGKALGTLAEVDIDLRDHTLRFTNMACQVAGGTVTGEATLRTGKPIGGTFSLGLQHISADKLLALVGGPRRQYEGTLDAAIRGRVGRVWEGDCLLRVTNGKALGVPITSARTPIDWTFAPTTRSGRAKVRLNAAKLAGGRVSGVADVRWTGRLAIEADAKFDSVDIHPLAGALPLVDDLLRGRLDGQVSLKGSHVRSADDLSGTFGATLARSQALKLPVLEALTASLGVGSSSNTFSETAVKGRFSNGVVRIDQMTMHSDNIHMLIDGKMTTSGRLDLSVTADAPQVTVVGIALGVLRPIDLLRRRLLFFHLGGSIKSPSVQARIPEFIQQEVIMFFWPFVITP